MFMFAADLVVLLLLVLLHSCTAASPIASASHVESDEWSPLCGASGDSGYGCVVREGQLVVIPCGHHHHRPQGFTYYLHSTGQVLLSNSSSHLHWYPRWNDTGALVCCSTHSTPPSSHASTDPCYHINVIHSPLVVPMSWPVGINKSPIPGHPYELSCPLQGKPPANYTWTRYSNVDRREKLNFADDVIFLDEGRKWRVGGYTAEHGGVYECHATNQIGEEHYSNDGLFFLKTTGCSCRSTRVTIAPPSATPTFDNGIVLTCTVEAPRAYGMKPYWFIVRSNSTRDMVSQWPRPFYDEDRCSWWVELRVKSVDSGARYVCQYGTEEASVELEISLTGVSVKLVSMVMSGATLVVGLILLLVGQGQRSLGHQGQKSQTTSTVEPTMTGFKYDVFVSAHDEMRQYVETNIIRPLESRDRCHAPYRVCWHLRDFVAGLSITEQIADAVSNSRKVLFVFSERFPESKFCQLELELAMKRLVDTNTRCLVPMATSEGVVPKRVKQLLTYCSVESIDDTEWTKLLGNPINADSVQT